MPADKMFGCAAFDRLREHWQLVAAHGELAPLRRDLAASGESAAVWAERSRRELDVAAGQAAARAAAVSASAPSH
jgi:hypothetical protein